MNLVKKISVILFLFSFTLFAAKEKTITKTIEVKPEQKIELNGVSGMDVKFVSWDKPEIKIDLKLRISSSDDDFELAYIKDFKIDTWETQSRLVVDLLETPEEAGFNFLNLFKLQISVTTNKNISGIIYIPANNPIITKFRYGEILFEDIKSELSVTGRGNELNFKNCADLREIENPYGDVSVIDSKGILKLETRSSKLEIINFSGATDVIAPYTPIKLAGLDGDLSLEGRSADLSIKDLKGNLILNAPYSEIEIANVEGTIDMKARSESVRIVGARGLKYNGPYTNLTVSGIASEQEADISIDNQSGKINISHTKGNIIIRDNYSDMNLKEIVGNIDLTSRSSKIRCEKIKGNWKSETQYSRIEIDEIDGEKVSVLNRSEAVLIDFLNHPKFVKVENTYGNIELALAKDYEGNFKIYSTYGNISSDFPLKVKTQGSSSNAYGSIGNSSSEIELETRSANITVTQKSR